MKDHFRRQEPRRIGDRNLRVSLPDKSVALVCTTPKIVTIHHLPTPGAEPDWSATMDVEGDAELRGLFHPQLGWDVIKLVGLVWRQAQMRGLTIDLRSAEERVRAGLRTETVSTLSQYDNSNKPARRRAEDSRDAIITAVEQSGRAMNRLDIARAIGRAKTPHLIQMIEGLVADGLLNRVQSVRSNGLLEFFYFR